MHISLGLKGIGKPLDLEVEMDPEQVKSILQSALEKPEELLCLAGTDGQQVLINPRLLVYCQVGERRPKQVGFGIG
ncbi:DUF3107 family protein [Varibaculum vaginae]|uniref:DUF3107 family protein n=1 Tax=Varibaculum vaginae TaxID=2364797 RepID=UPI000F0818D2|nr:DUF3107 family protein [Varibaculum vaginae]